jgi:hypothetical protein
MRGDAYVTCQSRRGYAKRDPVVDDSWRQWAGQEIGPVVCLASRLHDSKLLYVRADNRYYLRAHLAFLSALARSTRLASLPLLPAAVVQPRPRHAAVLAAGTGATAVAASV